MNRNDLKRLAGKAETESRSRTAAGALPDAAATEGLLDVAVGAISSPIGDLLVVVTARGLAAIAFEGDEYRDELLARVARQISPRILPSPKGTDPWRRELDEYFAAGRTGFELPVDRRQWRIRMLPRFRIFIRRFLLAPEHHGHAPLRIEANDHVRALIDGPYVVVFVHANIMREGPRVQPLPDLADEPAVGSELQQLRRRRAVSRSHGVAAVVNENVFFRVQRDPRNLAEIHIRRQLQHIRNRVKRNLRHIRGPRRRAQTSQRNQSKWFQSSLLNPNRYDTKYHVRLMSAVSSIDFGAPCFATFSIARPICSVVVTYCGNSLYSSGSSGPNTV